MSKSNKVIDKNLFYEIDYYETVKEDYEIKILNTFNDKLRYIKQLMSIFLKCFSLPKYYKISTFYNPIMDIQSTFLDKNNQIYLLVEANSDIIISFFMISKEYHNYNLKKIIISNACTAPLKTKKGYMTKLLKDYLENVNVCVELEVFEENPAKNLYESLGFRFIKYLDLGNETMDFYEDGMNSKRCLYRFKKEY